MVSAGLTINLIGYGTLAGPLLQHWPIFQAHKMQSKPEEGFQELGPAPAEAAAHGMHILRKADPSKDLQ